MCVYVLKGGKHPFGPQSMSKLSFKHLKFLTDDHDDRIYLAHCRGSGSSLNGSQAGLNVMSLVACAPIS